jgi:hypothetical protein
MGLQKKSLGKKFLFKDFILDCCRGLFAFETLVLILTWFEDKLLSTIRGDSVLMGPWTMIELVSPLLMKVSRIFASGLSSDSVFSLSGDLNR